MTFLEKLIKLEGKKPETLPYHQKMTGLKTEELAAKNLFRTLMTDRKEKAKAKKLGLI
jgi:hypothetical protein